MPNKTFGADLYGKGENPNGQTSITAEETMRNSEALPPQQNKWNLQADGQRFNGSDEHKFKRNQPFPPPKTR